MLNARSAIVASLVSVLLGLAVVTGVGADATYHTSRYQLTAVGNETGTGTVINAHANGPQVAANENYLLIGAQPNTAYRTCSCEAEVRFSQSANLRALSGGVPL